MSKEQFMRSYVIISLIAGLYSLIAILLYMIQFTVEMYVTVETTLFYVNLTDYNGTVPIFNMPLISFVLIFLINAVVAIVVAPTLETEKKQYKEVSYLNLTFSFLLIVGQLFFVYNIPSKINGTPKDMVFYTMFPILSDVITQVINVTYLLAFVYVVYNLLVLVQTREPGVPQEDETDKEENLLAEFLKE